MPEDKERLLRGETEVSHSSDESIQKSVGQIRSEIAGVNNQVFEGESLFPELIGSSYGVTNDTDETRIADINSSSSLTHKDARLGYQILLGRQKKKGR